MQELTEDQKDRVIGLLEEWGRYDSSRSNRKQIEKLTGQITCSSIYKWQRDSKQIVADSDYSPRYYIYSEDALDHARRVIYSLDRKYIKVVTARYRWSNRKTIAQKADMLKISYKTFYNHLHRAEQLVYHKMDWSIT